MKFEQIAEIVKGIPYTQEERGKLLYDHIIRTKPMNCLELGFAHGVASCYIAAALDEIGSGVLTSVDLEDSTSRDPNLEMLLEKAGLENYVEIRREKNSYTWFLKKAIEENSTDLQCDPQYDFCFIDGPKNWTIDGFAFFLVDKLMREGGHILFDDFNWCYGDYSKDNLDGITIRVLPEDQASTPNIKLVFELLVMQHPDYSDFVIDDDWAWAKKVRSTEPRLKLISSQSLKYKIMKKIRSVRRRI